MMMNMLNKRDKYLMLFKIKLKIAQEFIPIME